MAPLEIQQVTICRWLNFLFLSTIIFAQLVASAKSQQTNHDETNMEEQSQSAGSQYGRRLYRHGRSLFTQHNVMVCASKCNPFDLIGYGCYCGMNGWQLAKAKPVDTLDECCYNHDQCLDNASHCFLWDIYLEPYKWSCEGKTPLCVTARGIGNCAHQKCECDRQFAHCIKDIPCPKIKPKCFDIKKSSLTSIPKTKTRGLDNDKSSQTSETISTPKGRGNKKNSPAIEPKGLDNEKSRPTTETTSKPKGVDKEKSGPTSGTTSKPKGLGNKKSSLAIESKGLDTEKSGRTSEITSKQKVFNNKKDNNPFIKNKKLN